MTAVTTTHVEIDENGIAWVRGASTKVAEVVVNRAAYGWSPEEIHLNLPHLSLAQVYSALAYYYDNQREINAQIEREYKEARSLLDEVADAEFRQRLIERLRQANSEKRRDSPPLHGR